MEAAAVDDRGAKVSPLALRVYEALQEKGAQSASELASELGREVTKAAIQRALNELWAQLRVIPQAQQDDAPALWELTADAFCESDQGGSECGAAEGDVCAAVALSVAGCGGDGGRGGWISFAADGAIACA